ncbi:hypothetical protein OSTOST_18319, partial [Ostertagia ostertagi]
MDRNGVQPHRAPGASLTNNIFSSENGEMCLVLIVYNAATEDRAHGLIPFLMIASIGTRKTCGFDRLDDLGPVCYRERIYLHVDAAYG